MNDYVRLKAGKKFWDMLNMAFTDDFMKKYTTFENFDGFKFSSAVMVTWDQEYMIYSETLFNNFVIESTQFKNWNEMVMRAADESFAA